MKIIRVSNDAFSGLVSLPDARTEELQIKFQKSGDPMVINAVIKQTGNYEPQEFIFHRQR